MPITHIERYYIPQYHQRIHVHVCTESEQKLTVYIVETYHKTNPFMWNVYPPNME